jgi:hypothetical protein
MCPGCPGAPAAARPFTPAAAAAAARRALSKGACRARGRARACLSARAPAAACRCQRAHRRGGRTCGRPPPSRSTASFLHALRPLSQLLSGNHALQAPTLGPRPRLGGGARARPGAAGGAVRPHARRPRRRCRGQPAALRQHRSKLRKHQTRSSPHTCDSPVISRGIWASRAGLGQPQHDGLAWQRGCTAFWGAIAALPRGLGACGLTGSRTRPAPAPAPPQAWRTSPGSPLSRP